MEKVNKIKGRPGSIPHSCWGLHSLSSKASIVRITLEMVANQISSIRGQDLRTQNQVAFSLLNSELDSKHITSNSHHSFPNADKRKYFSSAPIVPRQKKICTRKKEESDILQSNAINCEGSLMINPNSNVIQTASVINNIGKHEASEKSISLRNFRLMNNTRNKSLLSGSVSDKCPVREFNSRIKSPAQIRPPNRIKEVGLKALYLQEDATQEPISTALETLHEDHDINGHKCHRITVFNPIKASKLKLKHRRNRARILRKQGVMVPTGNMF